MLFNNPHSILSEAATADMLNPEVSDEVKDTIEELEDTLTNNVEEVKDADKTTNGGIPVTTESFNLMEASTSYGNAKYLIRLEDVIAIKESEGEREAEEKMEEPEDGGSAPAPSEEECEECEPNAVNVIEDIAKNNGVKPDQVSVIINSESVSFLAHTALLEARAGKKGKDAKGTKKLKKVKKTLDELDGKVKLTKA